MTCVALANAPALGQSIVSSFNTDAEGWTADGNGAGAIVYTPTGGNPGGAVSITDVDNGYAYFRAPASFLPFGAYGGTIGFDLMTVATGHDPAQYPTQIALEGNGMTLINGSLTAFIRFDFDSVETDGWQIYPDRNNVYAPGANLAPTEAQMQAVLSNVTGVLISADYTNGFDHDRLDGNDRDRHGRDDSPRARRPLRSRIRRHALLALRQRREKRA